MEMCIRDSGKVRIFRLEENAARLQSTCRGILMPELSTERFKEAIPVSYTHLDVYKRQMQEYGRVYIGTHGRGIVTGVPSSD